MAFWFWLPWGRWALVLGWVAFPPWPSCGSCPCSLQGFGWGLVLLAFLFLVLWCLPISLDQPVEADSKADRRVLYLYEELTLTLLQVKIHTTGPGEAAPGRALPPGVQPSQLAGPPHPPHLYQKKPAGLYFQAGK